MEKNKWGIKIKIMFSRVVQGFTLVEIMLVVAIIALLSTMAIPGILRSRQTASESNGISTLKSIASAMEAYRAAQTNASYPDNLSVLTDASPAYISGLGGTGASKGGYDFAVAGDVDSFNAIANSTQANFRKFCIDQRGDLYSDTSNYTPNNSTNCSGTLVSL